MIRRALTDDDRARFAATLPADWSWREQGFILLFLVPMVIACGAIAAMLLAFLLDLLTDLPRPQRISIAKGLGWTAGLALYAAGVVSVLRGLLRGHRHKTAIRADLARGEVIEETAQIARLIRLREEEHGTELLLFETTDGRVRALLDDSTTNTEGPPRRSSLRLARELRVLRLPESGHELTLFEGEALRRPPARHADPRHWPETDQWLPRDSLARLMTAYAARSTAATISSTT